MTEGNNHLTEREAIEQLLPWYAAGTLSDHEVKQVDEYLAQHPDISRQLNLIREEMDETVHANEALGHPSAGALDRLMSAIEAEPRQTANVGQILTNLKQSVIGFFEAPSPNAVRWAAMVAAALIFVQAITLGMLISDSTRTGVDYRTASGQNGTQALTGTFALMQFSEDATLIEISTLLSSLEASIIDGPKPGGIYKVRISQETLSEAEYQRILREIQEKNAIVTLAMPTK